MAQSSSSKVGTADLAERCAALLDGLGLVFGAFDFIVSPDGALHFLEVNEMGQLLFLERG